MKNLKIYPYYVDYHSFPILFTNCTIQTSITFHFSFISIALLSITYLQILLSFSPVEEHDEWDVVRHGWEDGLEVQEEEAAGDESNTVDGDLLPRGGREEEGGDHQQHGQEAGQHHGRAVGGGVPLERKPLTLLPVF